MYKSNKKLVKLNISVAKYNSKMLLVKRIEDMIRSRWYVICPVLNRRRIYLDKYLKVNSGKRQIKPRLIGFSAGIELIKSARSVILSSKYKKSFELRGITSDNHLVVVHIREESFQRKNRKLYLISTYTRLIK